MQLGIHHQLSLNVSDNRDQRMSIDSATTELLCVLEVSKHIVFSGNVSAIAALIKRKTNKHNA